MMMMRRRDLRRGREGNWMLTNQLVWMGDGILDGICICEMGGNPRMCHLDRTPRRPGNKGAGSR